MNLALGILGTLTVAKWDPLALGHCPRCGATVKPCNHRTDARPMVVCPNDFTRVGRKHPRPCGFLWYAPWGRKIERERKTP